MSLSQQKLALYLSLLSLGMVIGWLGHQYSPSHQASQPNLVLPVISPQSSSNLVSPSDTPSHQKSLRDPSNFIVNVVEKVGSTVVRIDATNQRVSTLPKTWQNPLFKNFFGQEFNPSDKHITRGTGSGFIISSQGHILTNAHVISGSNLVKVTLKDGRVFEGKVQGIDPLTDVGVVTIKAEELPTVSLGRSDQLTPGQWAIAIGNPLGLDNSVTIGIISATGRSSSQVGIPEKRVRFIQTDAAINPGNSGGPLLNAEGEVIGINTAIRADGQGLGFAIPIESAKRIADQLLIKGRVEHPYLGITMGEITPDNYSMLQSKYQLKTDSPQGVIINRIIPDSPAEKGGLLPGDILLKIGGVAVKNPPDVQERIEESEVGKKLMIEINRGGKILSIFVKLTTLTPPSTP